MEPEAGVPAQLLSNEPHEIMAGMNLNSKLDRFQDSSQGLIKKAVFI